MSRETSGKLQVTAGLVAVTPISVGGAGAAADVDMAIAVDGRGRPYVPGSSLTGVVRAWLERHLHSGPSLVSALCGYQVRDQGHASWLTVSDAVVGISDGLSEEVRHGVQIERGAGVAREKFLFTRSVLPRGTTLDLRMELDLPRGQVDGFFAADFERAVGLFLEALGRDGLKLGAATSRGLGRLALAGERAVDVRRFSWEKDPKGLFDWLGRRTIPLLTPGALGAGSTGAVLRAVEGATFTLHWEPVSPVMSKSGFDGLDADGLPLVGGFATGKVAPVLPGSSIKGVLRAHAARILRTRLGVQSGAADPAKPVPDDDLPMVVDLFGGAETAGRVFVPDVYQAGNTMSAAGWRNEDLPTMSNATVHENHVGVDRFLGTQAAKRLYSARTPRSDGQRSWEPIRVEFDFERLVEVPGTPEDDGPAEWSPLSDETRRVELALLLLVLRDLAGGLLPLGFGAQRGMGEIRVTEVKATGTLLGSPLPAAPPGGCPTSLLDVVPREVLNKAGEAWTAAAVKGFLVIPSGAEPEARTEVTK